MKLGLDPRVRLLAAALASLCLALLRQIPSSLLGLALGMALLGLVRPRPEHLRRRLAAVNIFTFFLWCALPFTVQGESVALGALNLSSAGLRLALLVTLKANAIFCVFQALVGAMSPSEAGCALKSLGCPPKLAFLFLVAGRYIHVLAAEWQALMDAAKLRAFTPKAGLHGWRTMACLLGLLLVRGYDRSQRACEAMRLRAFTGNFTTVTRFRAGYADVFLAVGMVAFLAAVLWVEAIHA
ncbi:MAG: energy-coupling factor transporter transmembrane protein EcfT [Desulfovibrio sp.]|jgi:cobalt/nickel transport system permease protein|nr:energy-coupling factor transporter transmembrane protein EcfT [Desulfovibrio sp.]